MLRISLLLSLTFYWGSIWTISHSFPLRPSQPKTFRSSNHHVLLLSKLMPEEEESAESIQQRLVQYGLSWNQAEISSDMVKVPGCVASVYVLAEQEDSGHVRIRGNSDAIVSRGLIFLLNDFISHLNVEQIVDLDPSTITDQLGIRNALTKGRNDGISNMLIVIQRQLLGEALVDPSEGTSEKSNENKERVALLLSGGVDSSVALHLLLQQGYDVTAFYLKIWLEDELAHLGECPWEDDVQTCQSVCEQANVPLEIISLQEQYHARVMEHTLNQASQGRTPNPDILCNSRVKFGCFLEYLDKDRNGEFDSIASGHYAQLLRDSHNNSEPVRLVRAPDPVKDQSYFLCALKQHQLRKLIFPIGHLEKYQVRELAEDFQLPNRHRPDSQGLCFLGKVKFGDFLQIHLGEESGDIIDAFSGDVIGQHRGVWYHTVGQRKGIGKSLNPLATSRGPWYVVAKDPKKNIVFASNQYDEDVFTKARSEFHVENIHWISGIPPPSSINGETEKLEFEMKIRHGPRLVVGNLQLLSDDDGIIQLNEKDGGLAPGQYVVFYTKDANCLGGGIISERHWAKFLLDAESRRELETSSISSSGS